MILERVFSFGIHFFVIILNRRNVLVDFKKKIFEAEIMFLNQLFRSPQKFSTFTNPVFQYKWSVKNQRNISKVSVLFFVLKLIHQAQNALQNLWS